MTDLTNIFARSIKDLTLLPQLPDDLTVLDQVKIPVGNLPVGLNGCEALSIQQVRTLVYSTLNQDIRDIEQKVDSKLLETQELVDSKLLETQELVDSKLLETQTNVDSKLLATKTTVDSKLSENKTYTNQALSQLSTAANKFYPTLAEANASIASLAVNQPVTIGEAANGGLWYKATAGATSLIKSPHDPLTQAKLAISENLLFDPFNETVRADKVDNLQGVSNAEFSELLLNSVNSPFKKPTLKASAGAQARRYIDPSKLGLKHGEKVFIRILAHYGADFTSSDRIAAYFRAGSETVLSTSASIVKAGLNDVVLELTYSDLSNQLLIALSGAGVKELVAVSVSKLPMPKLVYGSVYGGWVRSINDSVLSSTAAISDIQKNTKTNGQNLLPDPFLKQFALGNKTTHGRPIIVEGEVNWEFVQYQNSPFNCKNAIYVPTTNGTRNRVTPFSALGTFKVGDTITLKAVIVSPSGGSYQMGFHFRNAANTVLIPTKTQTLVLEANTPTEYNLSFDLTQEMIDTASILEIRYNVAGATHANGWYCLGTGIFKNNSATQLTDSNASDETQTNKYNIAQVSARIDSLVPQIDKSVKNLIPDPFFRQVVGGIQNPGGRPLFNESASYEIVNSPLSPQGTQKAVFVAGETNQKATINRDLAFSRFGLKVGDKVTLKVLTYVPNGVNGFSIGFYARASNNDVLGSLSTTTTNIPAATPTYITRTIDITQDMIDRGYYFQVRLNVNGLVIPGGVYHLKMGVYVNANPAEIADQNIDIDELFLAINNLSNQNAVSVPHTYGIENLREVHRRLQMLNLGVNDARANISIAAIGDSWTHNSGRWIQKFAQVFWYRYNPQSSQKDHGPIGCGYTSFGGLNNSLMNGRTSWMAYVKVKSGDVDFSRYYTGNGPDLSCATLAPDAVIYLDGGITSNLGSTMTLLFEGGAGSICWSFDNGATWADPVDLSSYPAGMQKINIPYTDNNGQLSFSIKAITQSTLYGINIANKQAAGVLVHKLGATGSNTNQWATTDATRFAVGIGELAPNLTIIMHGTNDQTSGRSKAQFKANLKIIADRVIAASPTTDILLVAPSENQRTDNKIAMSEYAAAMYELATENGWGFVNLQPHFGVDPMSYAAGSNRPLFATDLIHPDGNTGGYIMSYAISRAVMVAS